mmetsp:Transcript_9718/g.14976  ORF Transcript_9718/g.14976 Transcript_9718/m.14976 type:complete len:591 (-) Transcript_9718:22-1794(-)
MRTIFVSSFFCYVKLLALTTTPLTLAQEGPNPLFQAEFFDDSQQVFRQDICDRVSLVNNGTLAFKDALQNISIRAFVLNDGTYVKMNDQHIIDEEYPGIAIEIMDEACRLAGCTWRDSFYALNIETFQEKLSSPDFAGIGFTEFFDWSTNAYDITVTFATDLLQRRKLGISFPEHWFESDIIMVAKKEKDSKNNKFLYILFAWSNPFSVGVWIMIGITILLSGFIYWIMEKIDPETDQICSQKEYLSPAMHTFLAAQSFTGHFEFKPRTHAARLFSLSLSFWALVIGASYTANLASFLVVTKMDSDTIDTVETAVRKGLRLCTVKGFASEAVVMKRFPNTKFVRRSTELTLYQGVREEICDIAITQRDSWRTYQQLPAFNGDCDLEWIGRQYADLSSGFATRSDAGHLCTSLITEVLDIHIKSMRESGFIDDAWERSIARQRTIDCQARDIEEESGDGNNETLGLIDTAGVFITHFFLVGISLIMVFWKRQRKQWSQTDTTVDPGKTLMKSFQNQNSGTGETPRIGTFSNKSQNEDREVSSVAADIRAQQRVLMEQNRNLSIKYEELAKLMDRGIVKTGDESDKFYEFEV